MGAIPASASSCCGFFSGWSRLQRESLSRSSSAAAAAVSAARFDDAVALASSCPATRTATVNCNAWSGPLVPTSRYSGKRQAAPLRPFLQQSFSDRAAAPFHIGDAAAPTTARQRRTPRQTRHRDRSPRSPPRAASARIAGIARRPGGGLGRRQLDHAVEADLDGHRAPASRAARAAQAPGQRPFRFGVEPAPQQIGDDQPEHPVAEEFEPLVIAAARAAPSPASAGPWRAPAARSDASAPRPATPAARNHGRAAGPRPRRPMAVVIRLVIR